MVIFITITCILAAHHLFRLLQFFAFHTSIFHLFFQILNNYLFFLALLFQCDKFKLHLFIQSSHNIELLAMPNFLFSQSVL
jgi:hypothetical protein